MTARFDQKWLVAWVMVSVLSIAAIGEAVYDAAAVDVSKVQQILNDPTTVHRELGARG